MVGKVLIHLFAAILELFTVFELSKRFRENKKGNYIVLVLSIIIYLTFSIVATMYIKNAIIMLAVNFIVLSVFMLSYKIKLYKILISISVVIMVGMSYEMITMLVVSAINNVTPEILSNDLELYMLLVIIAKFSMYFTIKGMIIVVKPISKSACPVYNALSLIFPVSSFAILIMFSYVMYGSTMLTDKILVLAAAVLLILANIGEFAIYDAIVKNEEKVAFQKTQIAFLEKERIDYSILIDSQIKANKEVHEIKHKMHSIKEYIKEDISKAMIAVDDLCDVLSVNQIINYCDNSDINALINMKYNKAILEKIKLNIQVVITKEIEVDSMDICVMLGNILDNAITANLELDEPNRNIDLYIRTQKNFLTIKCVNRTINTDVIIGKTTKNNKMHHGFGLQKIKELATRYNGTMCYNIENNEFVISITLENCISHPETRSFR